jgi:CheY-specific phosphatase CheX
MVAPTPPLPDRKLIEPLFKAVKHVFETNLVRRTDMVGVVTPEMLMAVLDNDGAEFVISAIKCTGECECTVAVVSPNGLNLVYARDFLDVDESLLQMGGGLTVYRDAAGEMNNMLAGAFRNMLSKGQTHLHLTPPLIVNGPKSLISSLIKAKSAMIAEIKVEEFHVYVCLWT